MAGGGIETARWIAMAVYLHGKIEMVVIGGTRDGFGICVSWLVAYLQGLVLSGLLGLKLGWLSGVCCSRGGTKRTRRKVFCSEAAR